ncbi:MAG: hypothetical protein HC905_06550 [Bacteroidales bacterium]|nr:hypothetical protein [Bacteroidales bacterium]
MNRTSMFLYYYVFRNFPTRKQHFISTLSLVQGSYFFLTGVWPIIDIHSFMRVTGPKEDIWLVKTVGALTIAISLVLFMVSKKEESFPRVWCSFWDRAWPI